MRAVCERRGARNSLRGGARVPSYAFRGGLLADAELLDEAAVARDVVFLDVVEQAPPPSDDLEETPTRVVVLGVHLEVLGQRVDALAEESHLHVGRAGVGLVGLVPRDDLGLLVLT